MNQLSSFYKIKREDDSARTYLFDDDSQRLYRLNILASGTWVKESALDIRIYNTYCKRWDKIYFPDDYLLDSFSRIKLIKRLDINEFLDKLSILIELEK